MGDQSVAATNAVLELSGLSTPRSQSATRPSSIRPPFLPSFPSSPHSILRDPDDADVVTKVTAKPSCARIELSSRLSNTRILSAAAQWQRPKEFLRCLSSRAFSACSDRPRWFVSPQDARRPATPPVPVGTVTIRPHHHRPRARRFTTNVASKTAAVSGGAMVWAVPDRWGSVINPWSRR